MITRISLVDIIAYIVREFCFCGGNLYDLFFSNFQISNTVFLTIVTMLYIIYPGLIYNWKFVPLTPFNHFAHLPTPASGNKSFLCSHELVFFPLLESTCK